MKAGWNKTDDASLAGYIDARYRLYSPGKLRDAALKVAVERSRHPIQDYLNSLPRWDGVERLDRLLINYLGAEDSEYVRTVTKKTLVAAVARVMEPGIKFDYMLVLNGPQGLGKALCSTGWAVNGFPTLCLLPICEIRLLPRNCKVTGF